MRKNNQILQNFFGKINDHFILNVLYVLSLALSIKEHKKRLLEIIAISNPGCSLDDFLKATIEEISYYENLLDEEKKYLMEDIIVDRRINVIKDTPAIWCFISLYWAYDLKHANRTSILSVYNPRIGDIALKFLLYTLKMKQKEAYTACTKHEPSFYEDISPRLVRIIDTLPVMYSQQSNHLNMQYFSTSKSDLALNFLEVQITNQWEKAALYVKDEKPDNNTIRYRHDGEDLNLTIKPSRMAKGGAFKNLDKTYNQLMQLFNLDLANSNTRYTLGTKQKSSNKELLPSVITPLEEELIHVGSFDPDILTSEDKLEYLSKSKVYRRDIKSISEQNKDSEDAREYVTPNAFQQHKRNVAFSSALSKQKLLLKSDYDIPIPEHLKAFLASLDTDDEYMKTYTGFFILNVVLGYKTNDLIHLLQESKGGLKNGVITVDIDCSLFARNYSSLLSKSNDKLKFSLPSTMEALIVMMKKTILSKDFDIDIFLDAYKEYIKKSVEAFPKRIIIKTKQVNRYLAQYMQENGYDVLTGKLATASYTQNDTAKLSYTSSRSSASEHSKLIKNWWDALGLSEAVCNILDINPVSSGNTSNISSEEFSGTSQAVEIGEANAFFEVLRQNIYDYNGDKDLHFNLVSIYTRYAMSILASTRPFIESANFTSYNEEIGMWMISEKSQDIASGTRLTPLCNTMNALLKEYKKLLEEKGLKNNFYLITNSKPVLFSSYQAHKFLQNTQDLEDSEVLEEYVKNVPLNSGRHLFVRKAIDDLVNVHHISTCLGHYAAGEEQFGIYSTLNVKDYSNTIKTLTEKTAQECGIKEL